MSARWFDLKEQRQVVAFPEGRDWRCQGQPGALCDFSEPEDARPLETSCPRCGGGLSRIVSRL